MAVGACTQHPVSSLLRQPPSTRAGLCCREAEGEARRAVLTSSAEDRIAFSVFLPLIFYLSINLVSFCGVLFCGNAGHSFSNTKLDELGLLGSPEAGLCSAAAADLPASRCVLIRFTHVVGGETLSLLCWRLQRPPALRLSHPSQALSTGGFLESLLGVKSLQSRLCFKATVGALTTTSPCY